MLDVSCPLTEQSARLETVRPRPVTQRLGGSWLRGRFRALTNRIYALLGRAPIVDPRAHDDFEELLEQLACEVPEPERCWREQGGALAAAAWNWPEERRAHS